MIGNLKGKKKMVTKKCYLCGLTKSASEFYKRTGARDNLSPNCKLCTRAGNRRYIPKRTKMPKRTETPKRTKMPKRTKTCPICGVPINRNSKTCKLHTASRMNKKRYYCKDCGTEISRCAKRCRSCATRHYFADPANREKASMIMKEGFASGRLTRPKVPQAGREGMRRVMLRCWANGKMDKVFTSPSKPEQLFAEALDNKGIEYKIQYRLANDGRPFDFYIPPKTLVEVDGIYWHDDDNFPGIAERDVSKTALAKSKGYTLYRLTDIDINKQSSHYLWILSQL